MNKFKEITREFVKNSTTEGKFWENLKIYWENVSNLFKEDDQILYDNPQEAIIWYNAKLAYIIINAECILGNEGMHHKFLEEASILAAKELGASVGHYARKVLNIN